MHVSLALLAAGTAALVAASSFASLTQLPAGPQVGTHAGNLVVGGSFEAGPPNALVYWATGTNGTPFAVPPGWTSSGVLFNYAQWGHTSTSPLNIMNSAVIPDGVKALYFGNGQGASVNMPPTFTASGEVTFPGTPTVTTSIGAPVILSQTVNTHLAPAPSYILSFWISGENSYFGGPADGMFGLRLTNTEAGDPIRYFAAPAGGASTYGDQIRYEFSFTPINPLAPVTLEFYNWGHFSFNGGTTELVLDDVIVNPIPEPGACTILLAGAGLLIRRRQ